MFAAPPELKTEVFARLPESFRVRGRRSRWVEMVRGEPTDSFLEGPSFDRAGNLHVVDIPYGRVFRISPRGDWSLVAEYDGEPNGLKFDKDGRAVIADYRNGLMLLEPASGRVSPLLERPGIEPFKGLNDLVFAENGDLYFTDQGATGVHDPTGRLFRRRASGQLETLLDNVPSPNGVVLNAEETILYLAVTRTNSVWRVPLPRQGPISRVGVFAQLGGGIGPDGLAMDEEGNLAVAHIGLGTVWLFSRVGEPLFRIRSAAGLGTSNLAYGGDDRRTLYITDSQTGSILTARLPTPGRLMYSQR